MEQFFIVNERLPSLNEYINANRKGAQAGASFKKSVDNIISSYILRSRMRGSLNPVTEPCEILIDFFESTKRRGADNIQSATKHLMDSLQKSGIIRNDNRRWVKQIYHRIRESESDYVCVYIFSGEHITLSIGGRELA